MIRERDLRTYTHSASAVFRKTTEFYGGLSNMAAGYPLHVNNVRILTAEALYQACRFPNLPEVQKLIIDQHSPMTAKMKSKPYRNGTRSDWDTARIAIMRWCLRLKLAFHWSLFGGLLLSTDDKPIVEESKKDAFWGAKRIDEDTLEGANVLGRLLMELREELKRDCPSLLRVVPPAIPNFLLFGLPIGEIEAHKRPIVQVAPPPSLVTMSRYM